MLYEFEEKDFSFSLRFKTRRCSIISAGTHLIVKSNTNGYPFNPFDYQNILSYVVINLTDGWSKELKNGYVLTQGWLRPRMVKYISRAFREYWYRLIKKMHTDYLNISRRAFACGHREFTPQIFYHLRDHPFLLNDFMKYKTCALALLNEENPSYNWRDYYYPKWYVPNRHLRVFLETYNGSFRYDLLRRLNSFLLLRPLNTRVEQFLALSRRTSRIPSMQKILEAKKSIEKEWNRKLKFSRKFDLRAIYDFFYPLTGDVPF